MLAYDRYDWPPKSVGGVETLPPSLASTAGTAVQARMPLMPLGLFHADRFLKAWRPKFSEVGSDRRVQVGIGGVAVGLGQRDPVIERRGDQGVGTGHDRRRHRRPHLGERQVIGRGCPRSCWWFPSAV